MAAILGAGREFHITLTHLPLPSLRMAPRSAREVLERNWVANLYEVTTTSTPLLTTKSQETQTWDTSAWWKGQCRRILGWAWVWWMTCESWSEEVQQGITDMDYYDKQTWKKLDPKLVEEGERDE